MWKTNWLLIVFVAGFGVGSIESSPHVARDLVSSWPQIGVSYNFKSTTLEKKKKNINQSDR